jgi:hypothetical protein
VSIRNWLILTMAGLALAACAPQKPGEASAAKSPEASEATLASNPAACAAKGGQINRVCMLGAPMCVITFKDAGRACSGRSDCGGARCQTEVSAKPESKAVGKCAATNNPCGCYQAVEGGVAQYPLCVD